MPYKDPLTADTVLVRGAIQSPNYVPGVSGWIVRQNGSAEFSNLIARGTITADQIKTSSVQTDPRIWINNPADDPNVILYYTDSQPDSTPIRELSQIRGPSIGAINPAITLRAWGTDTSDVEDTEILISGHPSGFIQLTAEDRIFFFAPGDDGENGLQYGGRALLDASKVRRYSDHLGTNLALSAAAYAALDMQIDFNTLRDNAECQMHGTFDTNTTAAGAAGDLALYKAQLDGVDITPTGAPGVYTPLVDLRTVHRETVSGEWDFVIPTAGAHSITFQGRKSAGVATVSALTSTTRAGLLVFDNNGGT